MKPFLKFSLNLFCLFLPVLFSMELEDTLFSSLPFPRISFRPKKLTQVLLGNQAFELSFLTQSSPSSSQVCSALCTVNMHTCCFTCLTSANTGQKQRATGTARSGCFPLGLVLLFQQN